MKDFLTGVSYVAKGFGLLWAPGLRRYVAMPVAVNVLVFAGLFYLAAGQFNDLLHTLLPNPDNWADGGWLDTLVYYLLLTLEWLLWPLFWLAMMVLLFYTFTLVANLIGSPFNSLLSARVERQETGQGPPETEGTLVGEIAGSVGNELSKYWYFAKLALPILVLFLIPGVNLIASLLWAIFGAWALALEYLDYPMGNRGMRLAEEREALRRRRSLSLGFGFAILAMTLIPGLNLLAMPTGVIGASLLWLREFQSPSSRA